MIQWMGFNGPRPYSIILWQKDEEDRAKTICYSVEEEIVVLERFKLEGDLYHSFDRAVIIRENGMDEVRVKEERSISQGLQMLVS